MLDILNLDYQQVYIAIIVVITLYSEGAQFSWDSFNQPIHWELKF